MVFKLTPVKIRDVWPTEDKAFTPWLVDNIDYLNEGIGLNIRDPQREEKLVNFYVDIVAEDDQGKIIIENQFNNSDHDHLGKLITYLSNVEDTKKAIWIVEDAKAEHVRAIEWLNQNSQICLFYLVKIQIFKVDNSPPAARFELISGPDAETIAIGKTKNEDSKRYDQRYKFWSLFIERSKQKTKIFNNITPGKYSWIGTSSGVRGINYNCSVQKSKAQCEIYIDRGKGEDELNKKLFNILHSKKDEIENRFGAELNWELLPNARASRISFATDLGGWEDENNWELVHNSLIEICIKIENSFSQEIKKLINFL